MIGTQIFINHFFSCGIRPQMGGGGSAGWLWCSSRQGNDELYVGLERHHRDRSVGVVWEGVVTGEPDEKIKKSKSLKTFSILKSFIFFEFFFPAFSSHSFYCILLEKTKHPISQYITFLPSFQCVYVTPSVLITFLLLLKPCHPRIGFSPVTARCIVLGGIRGNELMMCIERGCWGIHTYSDISLYYKPSKPPSSSSPSPQQDIIVSLCTSLVFHVHISILYTPLPLNHLSFPML